MAKRRHRQFSEKRRIKRRIKALANRLVPMSSYAQGCRGHPGLVIKRCYWPGWSVQNLFGASVTIKSIVDGVEEDCSIYYCHPDPISKEEAEARAHDIKTIHSFDLSIKHGYSIEEVKTWYDHWIKEGLLYYVLSDQDGFTVRNNQAYTKEDADKEVDRIKRLVEKGITNPRIVDMATYPVPITSFQT